MRRNVYVILLYFAAEVGLARAFRYVFTVECRLSGFPRFVRGLKSYPTAIISFVKPNFVELDIPDPDP